MHCRGECKSQGVDAVACATLTPQLSTHTRCRVACFMCLVAAWSLNRSDSVLVASDAKVNVNRPACVSVRVSMADTWSCL